MHRKDQPFWLGKFVKCCFYFWKLQLLKSLLSGWHWHTQKHLDNFPTWSVLRTEFMMSFCTTSWHISGTNLSSDKPFSNLMDKVARKSEGLQACAVGIVIVIDTQKFRNMQGTSQFLQLLNHPKIRDPSSFVQMTTVRIYEWMNNSWRPSWWFNSFHSAF